MPQLPAVEVFEDNWPTVERFFMVDMQWRVGLSGYTGLDASACHRDFEMAGVTVTPEEWQGIKVMAKAALNAWALERKS